MKQEPRTAAECIQNFKKTKQYFANLTPPAPPSSYVVKDCKVIAAPKPAPGFKARSEIIVDVVCTHFDIHKRDIRGPSRLKRFAHPRQICMYLMRVILRLSFPQIGKFMNRDHSTAIHGVRKMLPLVDDEIRMLQQQCMQALEGNKLNAHR